MARTVTSTGSTITTRVQDPYTQPAFSVYGAHAHSHGAGWICYNHDLEIHSVFHGDSNNAYSRFRTHSGGGAPEFYNNYNNSDFMDCRSNPDSSSERCNNTCNVGYLGHQNLFSATEYSSCAGYVTTDAGRQRKAESFMRNGSIVSETKQDYAIYGDHNGTAGTWFTAMTRSAMNYYGEVLQSGKKRFNLPQRGGGNYQGCYAAVCYNAKTEKLAVIEHNNSSHNIRPHVYQNVPSLRKLALLPEEQYASLTQRDSAYTQHTEGSYYDFFQDASNMVLYDQSTVTHNNYSGAGESYWRHMTCLCDNDKIVTFTMTPGNGCLVQRWNADGTAEGVIWNGTWTTSYGYEQGQRFGARWQVTTSGKYWWAYCPSYYYGAGIYWICIRVSDGKMMKFQSNDSTYGRGMAPIGENGMFWSHSQNADGPGLYFKTHELDWYMEVYDDNTTLSLDSNLSAYIIDCPTNTTNYPCIVPAMYDTSMFETHNVPRKVSS